jgi:genome maintenance exonuclease 1
MFYAMAFYEMTGIMVKKLVIIMTCENGECVVYEERDLKKYMKLVVKYIKQFVNDKLNEIAK